MLTTCRRAMENSEFQVVQVTAKENNNVLK